MTKDTSGPSLLFYDYFRNYRGLLHLVFWLITGIVFYYQCSFILSSDKFKEVPASYVVILYVLRYFMVLLLCYSFLYLVMPLRTRGRKFFFWLGLLLILVFWFVIYVVGLKLIVSTYPKPYLLPGSSWTLLINRQLQPFIFLFSFFLAFCYFIDINDRQKEIQVLEQFKTQKIALESSFLKSQINPHFLFNTFNNIYALSLKRSDQTAVIIEKLESLLHYMLYECQEELVPLENEFLFTNSYIALEKLRHREDRCKVTVNTIGDPSGKLIAPLLLINFLENSFKHGTKTTFGQSWINLDIKVEARHLKFQLRNSKPAQHAMYQGITEYKGGIGLKNVKRRLEILYPRKHSLQINDTEEYFEVNLSLTF